MGASGDRAQPAASRWAAPQFAATLAGVYQYCGTAYAEAIRVPHFVATRAPSAFLDVATGTNQYAGSTPYSSAGAGYDNVSGLGVPLGMPFANALCPNRAPGALARVPLSATPTTGLGPRPLDVTPHSLAAYDAGEFAPAQIARVQVVLRASSGAAGDALVTAALERAGFTIVQHFSDHLVIDAQAPAATIDAYFATRLHVARPPNAAPSYFPASPIAAPAEIAPAITAVNLSDAVSATAQPIEY